MIFGPIDHVGWASACSTRDVGELVGGAAPERPAARREQQAGDLAPGRRRRAQALVEGAVLAVDRHELGARRRPQRLHDRPGGDQALLVGQGQPLARRQRGDRDRQPGEADDGVDDDVGVLDEVGEVVDDGGERQGGGDLGPPRRVADGDAARAELLGLRDQRRRPTSRRRGRRPRSAAPRRARRRASGCRSSRTSRRWRPGSYVRSRARARASRSTPPAARTGRRRSGRARRRGR